MRDFTHLSIDEAEQVEETYERRCNAGRSGRILEVVVATAIVLAFPAYLLLVSYVNKLLGIPKTGF